MKNIYKLIEEGKQDKRPLYKSMFNWKKHIIPMGIVLVIFSVLILKELFLYSIK